MKKLIFTIAGSLLISVSTFAQGSVAFQNGGTSAFYFQSTASVSNRVTSAELGQQPLSGNGPDTGVLDVGLFWSYTSFDTVSGGTLAGIEHIGTTAGILAGNPSFDIAGTSPNDVVYLQIYAWDSSYGDSQAGLEACYETLGIFMACSSGLNNNDDEFIGAPIRVTLGATAGPGTPIFGTLSTEFGKTLYVSPEPGTIVVGGLGAVALILFRRRKQS